MSLGKAGKPVYLRRHMQTLRLVFSNNEANFQVAQRASAAASEGDFIEVNGSYFIVGRERVFPTTRKPPTVYKVERMESPKQVTEEKLPEPAEVTESARQEMAQEAKTWREESRIRVKDVERKPETLKAPEGPPRPESDVLRYQGHVISPGVRLIPKDSRRVGTPVVVKDVFPGYILTDKGRTIKATRLNRYEVL